MKKIIKINGMSCGHCQAKVEKALNSINGIKAKVDLKKKQALAEMPADIANQIIIDAIENEGFEVVSITEKKGLFGN